MQAGTAHCHWRPQGQLVCSKVNSLSKAPTQAY